MRLVPGGKKENLRYALEGKGIYEMHLENFMRKLKSGYFSSFREKEDEINEKLSAMRLK